MGTEYWNGAEAAHRRVMMKAAGYSDEDIRHKPHIGVPNSYMSGSPGTAHLRQVTEAVKEGIWAAGGIPIEFGIPATCGNVANGADEMKYEQVGRDIVAMSIEFVSRIHNFDAICCVASCDLILAGCYLAACRLEIPAMVVTGGSMQAGNYCGKTVVEADLDAARFSGASEEELMEMEDSVCPSFGACPSMGTANTMQMLGEVLNLVMPGTSTIPASDNARLRAARSAGKYMVELAKSGRTPKDLITKEVLENAIMFDMAVAGSTNAVLHILAYAYELGIDLTLADFAELTDVFYIGGTKVGALFGEAVVIMKESLKKDFRYCIKQRGGMLAKGRLLGIQFETLFEHGLYEEISHHAVSLALKIKNAFKEKGISFLYDSYTNQQFPILTMEQCEYFKKKYAFSLWCKIDEAHCAVRFCTSWATKSEAVEALIKDIQML